MITPDLPTPPSMTAADYVATRKRRYIAVYAATALLGAICSAAYVIYGIDSIALPLCIIIAVVTPVLLWRYPQFVLFVTLAATCLFEVLPTTYADSFTDAVPFFWNLNTVIVWLTHTSFKAVPLSIFELFLITAAICSVVRSVFTQTTRVRTGVVFWPMLLYLVFVSIGWYYGLITGGDFKISLQEVRAQFYFVIAYLIAVNVVREPKQLGAILTTIGVCVGIKGVLYTFRRYVTLHGMPLPDQGVGSHEEAFFFDCYVILLAGLVLTHTAPKLQRMMWLLLPFVLVGNLACNRRAATAAIGIAVPILLAAAYRALPDRRRQIMAFTLTFAAAFAIYFQAFKNNQGMLGQPAHAIQSQFAPDARDASSNAYRDAENADLMATIKLSPLIGYGYGKRMVHAVPIADISQQYMWWDIMTHNQILWVWMRVGTLGFVAFWLMICAAIIQACQVIRNPNAANSVKAVGILTIVVVSMLMIFGLLDLQLVNYRDMLFAGILIGITNAFGYTDLVDSHELTLRKAERQF